LNGESTMIQRDIHDMLRKEYDWAMTKLKRVQKENYELRNELDKLKREAKYWERQAKDIEIRRLRLEALLKVCIGTAP